MPVISVGNLAVGGTGKTPHTEYLIRSLKENYKIAVLSRGYKRTTKGFVLADKNSSSKTIGDEPFQIFSKFPDITVAVDEKRVHGVQEILKTKPETEVILLDDAFQHRFIKPGLSILLTDFNQPFSRDFVLPYGRLREKKENSEKADIIVVTKCPDDISVEKMLGLKLEINPRPNQRIFFSGLEYGEIYPVFENDKTENIKDEEVVVLTAIENPQPMIHYLEKKVKITEKVIFTDHHDFSAKELLEIDKKSEGKIIVTTEKDGARLKSYDFLSEALKKKIYALPLQVKILNNETNTFNQIIYDYVRKNSGNH